MTPRIPENVSTWLVEWSLVTIMANTMPPRDPNDDDDEEEEDEEGNAPTCWITGARPSSAHGHSARARCRPSFRSAPAMGRSG